MYRVGFRAKSFTDVNIPRAMTLHWIRLLIWLRREPFLKPADG